MTQKPLVRVFPPGSLLMCSAFPVFRTKFVLSLVMGMKGELQKMDHTDEHPRLGSGVNLENPRLLRDAVSAERKIMKIHCDFKEKYLPSN